MALEKIPKVSVLASEAVDFDFEVGLLAPKRGKDRLGRPAASPAPSWDVRLSERTRKEGVRT